MAKISEKLQKSLWEVATGYVNAIECWKEMNIDEFHELRIIQEEFEKVRKKLEARK